MHDFSRTLSKLQVIARNSDWFIPPFAPAMIGGINYFGIGFSIVIRKLLYHFDRYFALWFNNFLELIVM